MILATGAEIKATQVKKGVAAIHIPEWELVKDAAQVQDADADGDVVEPEVGAAGDEVSKESDATTVELRGTLNGTAGLREVYLKVIDPLLFQK